MQEKDFKEIGLTLKISDIKLLDFSALKEIPEAYAGIGLNSEKIQFEYNVSIQIDIPTKKITIGLNTNFFAEEQKTTLLGKIDSMGEFSILNIEEVLTTYEGKFPNTILASLIGVVISSSRGMLVLKSQGTIMEGVFMPIINPMVFFPDQPIEKP